MSDYEFLTGICKSVLDPVRIFEPVTEEERLDTLAYQRNMYAIIAEEV